MQQRILKIATLSLFIVLLTGFMAYRTGLLIDGDFSIQSESPANEVLVLNTVDADQDTTKRKKINTFQQDSASRMNAIIMSSSKSMILSERKIKREIRIRTRKAQSKEKKKQSSSTTSPALMGSSKSGAIILPEKDSVDTSGNHR